MFFVFLFFVVVVFALTYVSWSWCCDLLCVLTRFGGMLSLSVHLFLSLLCFVAAASCNMLDAQGMFVFVDVLGNDHSDQYYTRVINCGKSVKMLNLWTL